MLQSLEEPTPSRHRPSQRRRLDDPPQQWKQVKQQGSGSQQVPLPSPHNRHSVRLSPAGPSPAGAAVAAGERRSAARVSDDVVVPTPELTHRSEYLNPNPNKTVQHAQPAAALE